ncbi:E3 ubiquitin-protein ligase airp2, variant 2 [Trifolium repens]|nr:E3 ubiquitin-protein ligase airp2, variant 2 [Trifolium repens]
MGFVLKKNKKKELEKKGKIDIMRKSFKDSLKALEADIHFANTLASDYPSDLDGACVQMRLSYSPAAHLFLFLVQWTDCQLAGALGLLKILIYKAYKDGKTTMSIYERKASLKEFYGVVFPSLLQLHRGITDVDDRKQKHLCATRYKPKDVVDKGKSCEIHTQREEECDICMEMNTIVVLPNCNHSMCMKCYRDWHARSESCPFCRDSLKRVNSGDLWMYMRSNEIDDLASINKENLKRLFMYIEKLPLVARPYIHMLSSHLVVAS